MKLHKLHEVKTLSEMAPTPMPMMPPMGSAPISAPGEDIQKQLEDLTKGQENLNAALTAPTMSPAASQVRGMQNHAAAQNAQNTMQAPISKTAGAALNPTAPTVESDRRVSQSNEAGANGVKTDTF